MWGSRWYPHICPVGWGWRVGFQLLMLMSPNLPETQIACVQWGWRCWSNFWLAMLDLQYTEQLTSITMWSLTSASGDHNKLKIIRSGSVWTKTTLQERQKNLTFATISKNSDRGFTMVVYDVYRCLKDTFCFTFLYFHPHKSVNVWLLSLLSLYKFQISLHRSDI